MITKTTRNSSDFYISPKFKVSDYLKINLTENSQKEDWKKAVEIFQDRMNGRFLKQLDTIIHHHDKYIADYCGFTVIAIDCLIIETLNQFFTGKNRTTGAHKIKKGDGRLSQNVS